MMTMTMTMILYYLYHYKNRDWLVLQGDWVSMGVTSDGSYGIEQGLIYSFPVQIKPDHTYSIVQGLAINDFAREKMDATMKELIQERDDAVKACQE